MPKTLSIHFSPGNQFGNLLIPETIEQIKAVKNAVPSTKLSNSRMKLLKTNKYV